MQVVQKLDMCTQSKGVHVQIGLHKLVLSDNWLGPELKQLNKHLDRWGSSLAIETFASIDSTCVLPNIWAKQSASTSLMSYKDGRQT